MDPFSQAALGAVVGQAVGHRTLGYRAAAYGALAGALPDIDVFFSLTGDFADQLLTHRGITHSLFFAPVVGPVLGWLVWQRTRRRDPDSGIRERNTWILVISLALLSHPLLDLLTPYGTQLLQPFSNARFAINAMPIVDPVYTLALGSGLLLAWLPALRPRLPAAPMALATLLLSSSYLGYGWLQNVRAETAAAAQLSAAGVRWERLSAFPTILQVHLRRVVARSAGTDRVGFYSTWTPCDITWHSAARTDPASYAPFLKTRTGGIFDWFAMGWAHYAVTTGSDGARLEASDLRYGFDDDPLASVFTVTVPLDARGMPAGPARAGRTTPPDAERALERMVAQTYAPACQVFSTGAIPEHMDDNGAQHE
ncbi:MAG TPA: metal-dependent hydrolase [Pseudomonadales bacterium]